jgi:hypothetical protein
VLRRAAQYPLSLPANCTASQQCLRIIHPTAASSAASERGTFSAPLQEINWSSIVFSFFSAEGGA